MTRAVDNKSPLPKRGRQLSLRQFLMIMAAIGAILAVPGGALLLALMAGWLGIAVVILLFLILLQLPLFLLVKLWIRYDDDHG